MVIMTSKRYREEVERTQQKAMEEAWRHEREQKLIDRVFMLEERVAKLEGKDPAELYTPLTPVR